LSGKYVASSAVYANSPDELRAILGKAPFYQTRCLVQERVQGPGVGIFLLARHGDILARFAHRRIREKPPSGVFESICPPTRPGCRRLISLNGIMG
jgi:hypothetical protein